MATNADVLNFFAESNIKESLWEKMQQKVAEVSSPKKEISFDSLGETEKKSAAPAPVETSAPAISPKEPAKKHK